MSLPNLDPKLWIQLLTSCGGFLVALAGGAFALTRWIHEIRKNRSLRAEELAWKQKETLLQHIRAFEDSPGAHNAILMLSCSDREIPLLDKAKPEERYVRVSWEEVAEAMSAEGVPMSGKQSAIRDSFGDFLNRLAHLEFLRSSALLQNDDVKALLSPWVRWLTLDRPHVRSIRLWVRRHELPSVEKLVLEIGGATIAQLWEADTLADKEDNSRLLTDAPNNA